VIGATLWSRLRVPLCTAALAVGILLAFCLYTHAHAVERKLAELGADAPQVRANALLWLAECTPQDARRMQVTSALEPLVFDGDVRGTLDPDLLLRTYLHWADQDNIPALIRMVENHTVPAWSRARIGQVMVVLGKLQDARAAEVLAQRLSDPRLHEQAVDALKLLGPSATDTVMDSLFIGDAATQQRAGEVLASYGTAPKTVFTAALGRLLSNDQPERSGAASWFASNAPDDEVERGEAAGPLAELLGDLSPRMNSLALRALKLWGTNESLPQIVAFAARQDKAGISKEAAANNPALIDLLAQYPDESAAEALVRQLKDPANRSKASQALLKLGPVAIEPVLKDIDHPDPNVRKEALALCRLLKVPTNPQIEQTLADVADARKPRSLAALQHLAQLRPDEANRSKVSAALNAPLLDADPAIRSSALAATGVWATEQNTTTLVRLLGQVGGVWSPENALTTERITQALISIGPAVEDAVSPLLRSPEVPVRGAACRILGEVGTARSVQPLEDAGEAWFSLDSAYYLCTRDALAKITARQ
jgi:HEAT repeat protein